MNGGCEPPSALEAVLALQSRVVRVFSNEEEAAVVSRMRRWGWALQGRLEGKVPFAAGTDVPYATLDFTRPVNPNTPRLEHLEAQLSERLELPLPDATNGGRRAASARLFGWMALAAGTLGALLAAVGGGAALLGRQHSLAALWALGLGPPSAYCCLLFSREVGPRARKEALARTAAEAERQAEIERRRVSRERILAEVDRAVASTR
jgi:hypothetical protein